MKRNASGFNKYVGLQQPREMIIMLVKKAVVLAALLVAAVTVFAQAPADNESFSTGVYYSPSYATYQARVAIGNATTGANTSVVLASGTVALADGRTIVPFAVGNQVMIDLGTNQETVTLTGVSNCYAGTPANTCTLTGNFTLLHGQGALVTSASQGIQEAITDAQNSGGGMVYWLLDPGNVTLSTSGANTNLGSIAIPTRSTVMGAVARVTSTIGGCTGGWSLGYSSGTEFTAANTTLTAGTTTDSSTLTPAVAFNAAATVPVAHCTTSNASSGAIHARIWGWKMAAPAF